jgi:hypothetical protein
MALLVGLAFLLISLLMESSTPQRLATVAKNAWQTYVVGRRAIYVGLVLFLGAAASVASLGPRHRAELRTMEMIEARIAELSKREQKEKFPLSVPTTFLYLDSQEVGSLYGQFEPELSTSLVVQEIADTKEIGVEISAQDLLKTEAGRSQYQRRLEEYRKTEKSTERKLKDLLLYLDKNRLLKRFGDIELRSEELRKVDDATRLLTERYGFVIDKQKLKILRSRLLAGELRRLEEDLHGLRGLVLVEGDWSVELRADTYWFRRPFVENVTNAPVCEVKVRRDSLSPRSRDRIDGLAGRPMTLAVFGDVLAGGSGLSRTMLVTPIAVF